MGGAEGTAVVVVVFVVVDDEEEELGSCQILAPAMAPVGRWTSFKWIVSKPSDSGVRPSKLFLKRASLMCSRRGMVAGFLMLELR